MVILIVGSGGREHAIAWKLAQPQRVTEIYCAPGNGGTARASKCSNVAIASDDVEGIVDFARGRSVDLVVVGPEAPLVRGVGDALREAGVSVVGPGKEPARLEGSKGFAKEFMRRYEVPTARAITAYTAEEAYGAIEELGAPVVVKADGLAAGKGVVVAESVAEARGAVAAAMIEGRFGEAGSILVLEEMLTGFEASVILLTDGTAYLTFPAAKDHKRIGDGDTGPNTGGMGVVAPHPNVDAAFADRIDHEVIQPTIVGMRREKWNYRGFLFIGIMVTASGPQVLEYNVRLGDPEAQALLPLLEGDLAELLEATARGGLEEAIRTHARWSDGAACAVVAASGGYPGTYRKGNPITIPADIQSPVFVAGAEVADSALITSGGRVLTVTGLGRDLQRARETAYRDIENLHFDGVYFRRDIGAPERPHQPG